MFKWKMSKTQKTIMVIVAIISGLISGICAAETIYMNKQLEAIKKRRELVEKCKNAIEEVDIL